MSTHLEVKLTDIRSPPHILGNSRVLYNSVQIAKGKPSKTYRNVPVHSPSYLLLIKQLQCATPMEEIMSLFGFCSLSSFLWKSSLPIFPTLCLNNKAGSSKLPEIINKCFSVKLQTKKTCGIRPPTRPKPTKTQPLYQMDELCVQCILHTMFKVHMQNLKNYLANTLMLLVLMSVLQNNQQCMTRGFFSAKPS